MDQSSNFTFLFHRLGLVLFLLCLIIGPAIAQPAPEPAEQLEQIPKIVAAVDGGQVAFQANASMPVEDAKMYTLPELPYSHDALEPAISSKIMTLHHGKHHQTYITNLNDALASLRTSMSQGDVPAQLALQPAIRFNAGGHINHCLFWENMIPAKQAKKVSDAAPGLSKEINATWGGYDTFLAEFEKAFLGIQGSGWAWLVRVASSASSGASQLRIITTPNQEAIVGPTETVILACDGWEHAWYLDYLNDKKTYLKNWWSVVNWEVAEKRFKGDRGQAFERLRSMM